MTARRTFLPGRATGLGRATAPAITTSALEIDKSSVNIGVVQVDAAAQAVFTLTRTDKKLIVIYNWG